MGFTDAINKACESAPHSLGVASILPYRTLLIDGDGLAYYCAGKDGSDPQLAKEAVLDKIHGATRAARASKVIVLLTASGSTKGGRYAVARVKPYQGQRASSRRPDNWRFLRNFLEGGHPSFEVHTSDDQEADDLFAAYAWKSSTVLGDDRCVIYTQDKDMRMLPGIHLDWVNHSLVIVGKDCWSYEHNDKVYGRKWFWLQMLHGDTADNIPGLPGYVTKDAKGNEVIKPVGEVTARKLLALTTCEEEASLIVAKLYCEYYRGKECDPEASLREFQVGWTAMCEQAMLLWLQRTNNCYDVFQPGAPLAGFTPTVEIQQRIDEAKALNELARKTQDNAG